MLGDPDFILLEECRSQVCRARQAVALAGDYRGLLCIRVQPVQLGHAVLSQELKGVVYVAGIEFGAQLLFGLFDVVPERFPLEMLLDGSRSC